MHYQRWRGRGSMTAASALRRHVTCCQIIRHAQVQGRHGLAVPVMRPLASEEYTHNAMAFPSETRHRDT